MKKEPALLQLSSKSNRSFLGFEYNLRQNYNRYFIFTGDTWTHLFVLLCSSLFAIHSLSFSSKLIAPMPRIFKCSTYAIKIQSISSKWTQLLSVSITKSWQYLFEHIKLGEKVWNFPLWKFPWHRHRRFPV